VWRTGTCYRWTSVSAGTNARSIAEAIAGVNAIKSRVTEVGALAINKSPCTPTFKGWLFHLSAPPWFNLP